VSLQALRSEEGRRDPYAFYAELHDRGAACRLAPGSGYDVIVHGYDAVEQVLRDPVFRLLDTEYLDRNGTRWREHSSMRMLRDSLFFVNDPIHSRMRRLFNQVFTPRRVTVLEPTIARLTTGHLDRMAHLGAGGTPVDFMAEFAFPLPSDVMGELLGVPEESRAWFRPRVLAIGAILEPDGGTFRNIVAADLATDELREFFVELAEKRRAEPRDDLISSLVTAQAQDPDRLSAAELFGNLITVFNAGFVTTTHMLGSAVTLLLDRAGAVEDITVRPELVPAYVEEILRYAPTTNFVVRYAYADTEVDGLAVPAGSSVIVALGAANRDPARFPDPDRFDPARPDNRPLTFGSGPHYCLGAALTRAEGRLALPMLFTRFPRLALAGGHITPTQLNLRGYDTLPILVGGDG
jgi:cytochrome P450